MTRLLAAVAVLFLTGPAFGVAPCASAASETDITGEVRRGMAFAASLGGGLAFWLVPVRHGWTVWKRIIRAIEELQDREPPGEGEAVH